MILMGVDPSSEAKASSKVPKESATRTSPEITVGVTIAGSLESSMNWKRAKVLFGES